MSPTVGGVVAENPKVTLKLPVVPVLLIKLETVIFVLDVLNVKPAGSAGLTLTVRGGFPTTPNPP